MKAFRKALTILMIVGLCVTVLTGCKNPSDPPPVSEPAAPSTESNTDPETADPGEMEGNDASDLKDLAFVYNGKTITLSDAADDEKLESILGKAEENTSHTYASDDGLNMDTLIGFTEKQYKFPGLEIKTIKAPNDTLFYIFNIKITDSRYVTSRDIKVGDSVEKLQEAYPEGKMLGDGAAGEEDDFQYLPVDYVNAMKFHVKDKKVESILMYKLLD